MPPGKGPWIDAERTDSEREKDNLEAIVGIPIPNSARLTFSSDVKNKESTLEFAVTETIEELKDLYLKHLKVGNLVSAPTDQGVFFIAEAIGAACAREAWFGPGEVQGETLLRLIKRVNFSTPSVRNSFIKQNDCLRSFEHLFGISLLQEMIPTDTLKITLENVFQGFLASELPEVVVRFFRIQMSGARTVYMAAEKLSPHTVINMDTGLIATINATRTREGTYCSLSQALQPIS